VSDEIKSLLDAGGVAPSDRKYVVTHPHAHKTLKTGDVVVMVCTPKYCNLLLRIEDMTLHDLEDEHDQYVHMADASNAADLKASKP
jgi:NADH:ubiquinone oxidoreductase subunit E